MRGVSIGGVDESGRAELFGYRQTLIIQVDHKDRVRRVQLRGQQNSEPNGSGSHDGNCFPWRDLSVQNATLKAGRQNIAEHHHGFFIFA